jgi:glycosyltransferase involved in cell wall biosynthesis
VVHSEHGIDSQFSVREPLRRTGFRRAAFELADQVICVSNQLRSYHASRTGFSQQRITVIHNGVDVERFAADPERRAAARRDLGLSENNFCIGCIGNLTPVKDYMTLFRAMARVAHGCADWRVIIVGDGPLRDQLENFVRESALRDQVSFHGLTERVSDFLNAFDVYALTSVSEGISNSLLESMATGLPVVVTATGGNPEVVADKESGLLFPVGDFEKLAEHLLLLKARPDLRLDFGRQARRRVNEEFSIDSMIQRYHCLYTSLAPLNRVVNHRGIEAN